jgi:hypothetical protein
MFGFHLLSDTAPLDNLTSFGAAGLMGAMWLWERRTSRKREDQLDEAHVRILGDRVQLEELMGVVRQNAEAIARLCTTQDQLLRQIGRDPSSQEVKP